MVPLLASLPLFFAWYCRIGGPKASVQHPIWEQEDYDGPSVLDSITHAFLAHGRFV